MKIELVDQAAQPVLYVRITTSLDELNNEFDKNFALLESYLSELGEQPASAPYAAYYNHDMQNLDVEMGFPVASALSGKDEIQAGALPAFTKAVCGIHKGPYSSLDKTYEQIYAYIANNKLEQSGAHYDFYVSNPDNIPEAELVTKIIIPVKEKGKI